MMKLMGNSSYGKCITNFLKNESVRIVPESKYAKNVRNSNYKSHEDLIDGYEFRFKKSSFKQCLPIQIGFAVYQLAKLRMLQFYYDCIDYYIDRSNSEYCEMDTDSAYIAITSGKIEDLIKSEKIEHFNQHKSEWSGRDDTLENILYDKRTPGLFKLEFEGDGIIALSSEMYYCFGETNKLSSKGINEKQNAITKQNFDSALNGNSLQKFTNTGFRVKDNQVATYTLNKTGMKLFNDKRLRIGTRTLPPSL